MSEVLGGQFIVESKPGAGGNIAATYVARSAPDGYQMFLAGDHHATNTFLNSTLPYHPVTDFEPVSLIASNPQLLVAKKSIPAKDLKELVEWVKANQDKISAGTAGAGAASHVSGVYFQSVTNTKFTFVPYRGTGPALQDVVAGNLDLMFDQAASALPQVRNGNVRAFAVTAKNRLASEPNIPTVDEAGMPGFYIAVWHALWFPKGTPKDIVAKLNAEVVRGVGTTEFRERLRALGADATGSTVEDFSAFIRAEARLDRRHSRPVRCPGGAAAAHCAMGRV